MFKGMQFGGSSTSQPITHGEIIYPELEEDLISDESKVSIDLPKNSDQETQLIYSRLSKMPYNLCISISRNSNESISM